VTILGIEEKSDEDEVKWKFSWLKDTFLSMIASTTLVLIKELKSNL
jgi:hypothetical protein